MLDALMRILLAPRRQFRDASGWVLVNALQVFDELFARIECCSLRLRQPTLRCADVLDLKYGLANHPMIAAACQVRAHGRGSKQAASAFKYPGWCAAASGRCSKSSNAFPSTGYRAIADACHKADLVPRCHLYGIAHTE